MMTRTMIRTHTTLALATLAALGLAAAPAAHAQQTLYVSTNANTIDTFSSTGTVSQFATDPGDGSVLDGPQGLAFDSTGNLYAANNGDNTITEFTPGGVASQFASEPNAPQFLAFGPAPAPEPSQFAAFGVGLLGLGALALRARKRQAA